MLLIVEIVYQSSTIPRDILVIYMLELCYAVLWIVLEEEGGEYKEGRFEEEKGRERGMILEVWKKEIMFGNGEN